MLKIFFESEMLGVAIGLGIGGTAALIYGASLGVPLINGALLGSAIGFYIYGFAMKKKEEKEDD